jgi:hypothetical protein
MQFRELVGRAQSLEKTLVSENLENGAAASRRLKSPLLYQLSYGLKAYDYRQFLLFCSQGRNAATPVMTPV